MAPDAEKVEPLCAIFNECGGCSYQHISYANELKVKEMMLKSLLDQHIPAVSELCEPIVASPKAYYYRNRIDLKLIQTRAKKIFIGFTPKEGRGVIPIESCAIADRAILDAIVGLKEKVQDKLTFKYRQANIEIKTGDDGRVYWGGIGRKSLRLDSKDYLWTEINGKKIFYSLDTFFQANLSILPLVIEAVRSLDCWGDTTTFYDVYGGVGLFGISLADKAAKVILIEDNLASIKLAHFNREFHGASHLEICYAKAEEKLAEYLRDNGGSHQVIMVDPPRAGLSAEIRRLFTQTKGLTHLLYLSCNPETLARDLKELISGEWRIQKIIPFDFFPKTKHLETFVVLVRKIKNGEMNARG